MFTLLLLHFDTHILFIMYINSLFLFNNAYFSKFYLPNKLIIPLSRLIILVVKYFLKLSCEINKFKSFEKFDYLYNFFFVCKCVFIQI